jgi:hypothetical protein
MENTGAYAARGTTAVAAAPPAAVLLTIGPNPVAAGRTVRIATETAGRLAVYDAPGRRCGGAALGAGETLLGLGGAGGLLGPEVAPGVYFLRFTSARGVVTTARLIVTGD